MGWLSSCADAATVEAPHSPSFAGLLHPAICATGSQSDPLSPASHRRGFSLCADVAGALAPRRFACVEDTLLTQKPPQNLSSSGRPPELCHGPWPRLALPAGLLSFPNTGEASGMEFVCSHCDGRLLGIVDIGDKTITVECLSCGKESVIERKVVSMPSAEPPAQRSH